MASVYEKVSYHSKTLLHRNQAQARLWFARQLFKNAREMIKVLTYVVIYALFFLMSIFWRQSFGSVLERCSENLTKFTAKNLCLWPAALFKKRLCYRCLNFVKVLRMPFLIEPLWWLPLVFSFKQTVRMLLN